MKKMKAFVLSLVLGLSVATAVTAVGCKKDVESSSNSSSSNWFEGEVESNVSLRFATSQVDVYQYESVTLECVVKGMNEAVQYSSSDTSIATVDANGVVTAKDKTGVVTITATAEGVSATCKVNVTQSLYYPQITVSAKEYTVENGETLKFSVATTWNKAELSEDIEYAVSFAEDSKNAAAEISIDGAEVTVVSKGIESFNFIVSATVRGIYTSEQISVTVVAPQVKLQPATLDFKPQTNGYKATLSATDLVGNMTNSLPLNFVAVQGEETFEDVEIAWSIASGSSVKLEEGNVIGQARGLATLTGTATVAGQTVSVTVDCNVVAPEVKLERTAVFEVADIVNSALTFESGELIGTLQNAELHGKQVSSRITQKKNILFNKAAFPTAAKLLGKQELIINTDLVRYVMDVEIYTRIINDADEFDLMLTESNTGETEWSNSFKEERNSQYFDGYYVLGNDISYNKEVLGMTDTGKIWQVQRSTTENHRGFIGVFDGCGYNIDGVTVSKNPSGSEKEGGGIFGSVGTGGIVRNVSFTNAVLKTGHGFICAVGDGTIENVSISYKKIGSGVQPLHKTGSFFADRAGSRAVVRNCLVDATAADIAIEIVDVKGNPTNNLKLVGSVANVENVVVLCPDANVLKASGADVQRKSYVDVVSEPGLFKSFDKTIWTNVEGVPMFVNQANNLDTTTPIEFLNVDPTIIAGFEMVVRATNPYVKIDLVGEVVNGAFMEGAVDGVKFADSLLTAQEIAFKKTVRLQVTSLFNSELTATCDVYIDSFGSLMEKPATEKTPVVYNTNPVLTIGDNSWIGDAEQVYVYLGKDVIGSGKETIAMDWQKLSWGENTVTVVLVKNPGEASESRQSFTTNLTLDYTSGKFEDSKLIFDSAFSGNTWDGVNTFVYSDVPTDPNVEGYVAAPEGFTKVNKVSCATVWESAMSREIFNKQELRGYSDIWFAIKFEGEETKYVFQTESLPTTSWVHFHYVQTSDGVWVAEVTYTNSDKIGGEITTVYDIVDLQKATDGVITQNLSILLYRGGWSNGFLLYNNGGNASNKGKPTDTKVYVTEIRGIEKD